ALFKVTDTTGADFDVFTVGDEGATTLRSRTNSSTAFQLQNAGGSSLLTLGTTGTAPVATIAANTSFAGLVVDNNGAGDLFTASKSGATKFTILNNGNVKENGYVEIGDPIGTNTGLILDARDHSGNTMTVYSATGGIDFIASATVGELNTSGQLS